MNRSTRLVLTALTALTTLVAAAAVAQARPARQVVGDGYCAPGERLMSSREARRDRDRVCRQLDTWAIARLAGGGSMDGPGYGCKVRKRDRRHLGHSVCVGRRTAPKPVAKPRPRPQPKPVSWRVDVGLGGADISVGNDVYRPAPRPDVYRPPAPPPVYEPAPRRSRPVLDGDRIALRTVHGTWLSAPPGGALRSNAARMGKRELFTLLTDRRKVRDGALVSLQSHRGHFAVAEADGRANANRGLIGDWERWGMESADGHRTVMCGDRVHLRSAHDTYLVAEPDGRANANRGKAKSWETFTLVCVD